MPVYTYRCADCGDFDRIEPMAAAGEPRPCGTCGQPSPGVITAPRLGLMGREQRHAHATNERSRHEPRVSRPGGCGHDHAHDTGARQAPRRASGPARPWMLGH